VRCWATKSPLPWTWSLPRISSELLPLLLSGSHSLRRGMVDTSAYAAGATLDKDATPARLECNPMVDCFVTACRLLRQQYKGISNTIV
jgi:hypothetical protein